MPVARTYGNLVDWRDQSLFTGRQNPVLGADKEAIEKQQKEEDEARKQCEESLELFVKDHSEPSINGTEEPADEEVEARRA